MPDYQLLYYLRPIFTLPFLLLTPFPTLAQVQVPETRTDAERPQVLAVATEESIRIDGRLDEAVWRAPPAANVRASRG